MTKVGPTLPLRFGIVGTGHMAAEMAWAAVCVPDLQLTAVLSRESSRASEFCASFAPGALACSQTENFLAAVDAIYIAVPPGYRESLIKTVIARGKPVLCEKPFALTVDSAETLIALAAVENVLLMEAIWTLALPAYQALQQKFDAPLKPTGAHLSFDFSVPLDQPREPKKFNPMSLGVLLDRGVYGYAAALSVMGPAKSQTSFVTQNKDGVDTSAETRLVHESENTSIITVSFDRMGSNALNVATEKGLATLGPTALSAERLYWRPRPQPAAPSSGSMRPSLRSRLKSMSAVRGLYDLLPSKGQTFSFGSSQYVPVLREFSNAIRRGDLESPVVPHALTQSIAALTEGALNLNGGEN